MRLSKRSGALAVIAAAFVLFTSKPSLAQYDDPETVLEQGQYISAGCFAARSLVVAKSDPYFEYKLEFDKKMQAPTVSSLSELLESKVRAWLYPQPASNDF